jgi:hypothetical protein
MIEIIEGLPNNVVGIAVTGRVTKKDCYDVLMPAMENSRKGHDKIRLYYEINSRFPGAAWDDLNVGIEYLPPCERLPDRLRVPRLLRRLEDACLDRDDRGGGRPDLCPPSASRLLGDRAPSRRRVPQRISRDNLA